MAIPKSRASEVTSPYTGGRLTGAVDSEGNSALRDRLVWMFDLRLA
jgi:hypothetical protein